MVYRLAPKRSSGALYHKVTTFCVTGVLICGGDFSGGHFSLNDSHTNKKLRFLLHFDIKIMVGYDSYRDPYNDRLAYQINPYIIGQQPKKNEVQYRHQQKHSIEHSFKFEWPPAETQKKVFRTSAYGCWIWKERLTANPSHGNPYPSFFRIYFTHIF